MLFVVLIDNCVVLLVNIYAVFIVHLGLTLITFKKETTLTLWIFEAHLSVLSYATSILVQMSVLIIWLWDCYQLTDLISNFFRNCIKISQFLSHFGVFITNNEEGVLHCSQNLTKEEKIEQSNLQMCMHKVLLCYAYIIMFLRCLIAFSKFFY